MSGLALSNMPPKTCQDLLHAPIPSHLPSEELNNLYFRCGANFPRNADGAALPALPYCTEI